jgi:hypothetical protein
MQRVRARRLQHQHVLFFRECILIVSEISA